MKVNKGATDVDFPMDIAVYIRLRAVMMTSDNKAIEGTEILSNVVSLNKVHLLFSLPPVNTPENLYIVGGFNEWNWGFGNQDDSRKRCNSCILVYGMDRRCRHQIQSEQSLGWK